MIEIKSAQDQARLRRLTLASQGLLRAQPFGTGMAGARKAIQHLGYVQIDTISVVERAHQHALYNRVPKFVPGMINQLLLEGNVFEYWSHAAAFLPMADFRYSLPYKQAIKNGQIHWFKTRDDKLMHELMTRIRSDGPLRARDLESGSKKRAGWWDWKPAKKALEQLYMQGDLMVSDRHGFQKAYDLTERVLPSGVNTQLPSTQELAVHLLDQQLSCHGVVSLAGLTYLRRNIGLRQAMQLELSARLRQGLLDQLQLPDGHVYYVAAGAFDRPLVPVSKRVSILSPFDNCLIQRKRLSQLFQFDYQIECYLPAAKRQYGYFCLPLLYRDKFIGRMDCKAHRKESRLEIKSLHFSDDMLFDDGLAAAFADAVRHFCHFQACTAVTLGAVHPQRLRSAALMAIF